MKRSLCLTAVFIASLTACKQNTVVVNNAATAAGTTANIAYNSEGTAPAPTSTGAIDTAFVTDAIKGDNGEIEIGQLAQQKGASQGVKDFGKTLATDHSAAKQQLVALADQAGIAVPTEASDASKTNLDKLKGLSGDAFDKAFVPMMIESHQNGIAKFQKESQGSGPAADVAKQQLPTLQKHLQIAKGLQK